MLCRSKRSIGDNQPPEVLIEIDFEAFSGGRRSLENLPAADSTTRTPMLD